MQFGAVFHLGIVIRNLDEAVRIFREIYEEAIREPQKMHEKPLLTKVRRPDEVGAARNPRIHYDFEAVCR